MSRQNKVNPGMYTQRGRLTQDDAARELRKQSAIGSPHTWQPVNTKAKPWPAAAGGADRETERPADTDTMAEASPEVERRPASPVTRNTQADRPQAKAKAAKAKTARTRASTKTTGKAKTVKARTAAMKRTAAKPTRKAARARNVGRRGAAARPTTKRRRS